MSPIPGSHSRRFGVRRNPQLPDPIERFQPQRLPASIQSLLPSPAIGRGAEKSTEAEEATPPIRQANLFDPGLYLDHSVAILDDLNDSVRHSLVPDIAGPSTIEFTASQQTLRGEANSDSRPHINRDNRSKILIYKTTTAQI